MGAEAEAQTKAKGEAEVKAGIQRAGNKVRRFLYALHKFFFLSQDSDAVQLDVTTKEKDSAEMRPLHADSKGLDKYGLFNAGAWIKKGGAKKKMKKSVKKQETKKKKK